MRFYPLGTPWRIGRRRKYTQTWLDTGNYCLLLPHQPPIAWQKMVWKMIYTRLDYCVWSRANMERKYQICCEEMQVSIAGASWRSHPDNMLILFKGLSLVDFWILFGVVGCVCFAEMAETHLKKLERFSWRGLRVSLP
jgi:hypothetical protein